MRIDITRPLPLTVCVLAGLAASGYASSADIDRSLLDAVAARGSADALIVFPDQATPLLAPLDRSADYLVRRRALVAALRARSDAAQSGVRDWLDAHGMAHRDYWIANVIEARLSRPALDELARRGDVARIAANPEISAHLPRPEGGGASTEQPTAIEWGVMKINAPEAWAAGDTGQGVVIAGEDTGYQWDHPALKAHYRGWDGSTADHNYNWHDAIHDSSGNPCGNDSPAPCDDVDHGTHTAGTFAGDDGGSNQTGVAPGAKWIGCRNMDQGDGTPARYIECMQWMLAPTDLADQNPEPDLAPDVISNSWGCIPSEGCTVGDEIEAAVDNVVAGGIFFAAAAANDGPGCGSITNPPAIYDASFVVGATDSQDRMAGFSSRGPVVGVRPIRPDLSAPGVSVRSSVPPDSYATFSGTSMATPHVAGAAALVMSIDPALKGNPARVGEILRATTVTEGITDPANSGCGGLTMDDWPNYQAGYGRLDAWAAVQLADTVFADGYDD
ncbi:MAG TPA: S8 family serine peptidase [Rhodanobacteraceae bacterium]|nr:S8 family serine peptidase [Rhodanobacteraceae bacterium]